MAADQALANAVLYEALRTFSVEEAGYSRRNGRHEMKIAISEVGCVGHRGVVYEPELKDSPDSQVAIAFNFLVATRVSAKPDEVRAEVYTRELFSSD